MAISESGQGQSLSGKDVLESLADSHQKDPVTLVDLADWLASGECPQDTLRSAAASVWQLIMMSTGTVGQMADELMPQLEGAAQDIDNSESWRLKIDNILTDYFNREVLFSTRAPGIATDIFLEASSDSVVVTHIGHHFPLPKDGPLSDALSQLSAQSSIEIPVKELVTLWNETPETERPKGGFPLDILYLAWLKRPQPVEPSTREQGRIIPAKIAQVAPGDRRAGKLFTTAAHVSPDIEAGQLSFSGFQQLGTSTGNATERQSILPGFQDPATIGPCLPLALYDLGDAPATSRGPAAPLALRLFVESVLAVPMDSRDVDSPVAMKVTLRQMLDWIYPGKRKPRPNEYWPRMMAAFDALESPAARVPLYNPDTGQGEMRRIVSISGIPRGPNKLDDWIRIIVDLPAGSGNGPQVSDNLRQWGVQSAAAYRALLNLAYRWFEPGRTHFPVGRGKRQFWAQVNDAKRYPALTDDELIALCFPTSQHSQHWRLKQKGLTVIRQLEKAGELRIVEGHILPPAPAI